MQIDRLAGKENVSSNSAWILQAAYESLEILSVVT